jgi:hypothetical protein
MIRLNEVRDRLATKAPEFGTLGTAAQFAQVIEEGQLPQTELSGFVLPGPISGGVVTSTTGLFVQSFTEQVWVVLVIRSVAGELGEGSVDQLPDLVRTVIEGVVGWGPDDAPGVFALGSAELVGSKDGAVLYEIHFGLLDQMRVTP